MPEPDPAKTQAFGTADDLREWLGTNHDAEDELWIKVYKKASGVPSVAGVSPAARRSSSKSTSDKGTPAAR